MHPAAPVLLAALALAPATSRGAEEGVPCAPGGAFLVDGLGTPEDDYVRVAEDAGGVRPGPGVVRRGGLHLRALCADASAGPWAGRLVPAPEGEAGWAVVPVRLEGVLNTNRPEGANDGLLWAGRGASAMASGGIWGRWRALSAQVAPAVAWSQNAWFETVPTGASGDLAYANAFYGTNIDLPQRFGAGPFASWSPGESFVRVDGFGAALGISTERVWIGPGQRNALMLSGTGPGFPHLFLGTSGPADLWILDIDVQAIWGELSRSRYFQGGDHPWIAALAVEITPHFARGLRLGFARAVILPWSQLVDDGFVPFLGAVFQQGFGSGDHVNSPNDNGLGVFWARWAFPEVGFEVYGEWGKEDMEVSSAGFTRELDRSQGWLAGLQKVFRWGPRWVRMSLEHTQLQAVHPDYLYSWYTHGEDLSWTNRGQLLGASVGPGGSALSLDVDVFGPGGRVGGFVERTERNQGYYWQAVAATGRSRDVELAGGLRGLAFLGPVSLSAEVAYGYRWDRDFLGRDEGNFRLGVSLAYRPAP